MLNLKSQIEEGLKNELGKAIKILEAERNVLLQIEAEQDDCIKQINSQSRRGVIVRKLCDYSAYISLLKKRLEIQKENINLAQQNVDKVREDLVEVVQQRKMLEKLKDKKYQEYMQEQLRQEQKMNDEIVSFKQHNLNLAGENNG